MMSLAAFGYVASTVGLVGVSLVDPATAGELASKLGTIGVLGASNIYLGRALAKVYRDNRAQDAAERARDMADRAKLITLIESNAALNQSVLDANKAVMRAVELCHARGGGI